MVTKDDSALSAYLILLAMGIHGFFAGMAFGVSNDITSALNMLLAILAHKWSEALTIGISFVNANISLKKGL